VFVFCNASRIFYFGAVRCYCITSGGTRVVAACLCNAMCDGVEQFSAMKSKADMPSRYKALM
jgi:hypothetical protein